MTSLIRGQGRGGDNDTSRESVYMLGAVQRLDRGQQQPKDQEGVM